VHTSSRDDAVLNALADFVTGAGLKPGDRLPTERVLAEHFKVSRTTVREALTRWQELGLVERRQGSGTYLKAAVTRNMLHLPLTLPSGNDFNSLMHTLEIRRGLEAEAAVLCAERASDADIALIEQKLIRMEEVFHERSGMSADEDWDFHLAVFRTSGNPLFEQIIAAMYEMFHRFWEHPLGVQASVPYHRSLFNAIAARDPVGARAEALKLIATVEDDLKRGNANLKKQTKKSKE
jgi:GntR family transcriptional repressor for pyruvate dehydrogenase complex